MYDGLKHMAKTGMEAEQLGAPTDGQPVYPYNLCISLTNSELEKLGLDACDEDCKVGNYVHIAALAEIVGISKVDTGDGEKHNLNLQITHMECCEADDGDEDSGAMPY